MAMAAVGGVGRDLRVSVLAVRAQVGPGDCAKSMSNPQAVRGRAALCDMQTPIPSLASATEGSSHASEPLL
jgi:hypothetical protein